MAVTVIPGDAGEVAGYLCVAEDVTEREATHRALVGALDHERSAVDRLRELEQIKSDFVAAVSHELRTPLTSMTGYIELLEDGEAGELSAEQRILIGRVQRNGRRLLMLVEDLLLLSNIETRALRMSLQHVDCRDVVAAAVAGVQPLLAGRRLDVAVDLPETPLMQHADPDQLERLMLNLLSNAVKFTPDGGRVSFCARESVDAVTLVVADTGLGIPTEQQGQLFTRFFRSTTATEHAIQGAGMGLTIVDAIVTAHGGVIDVDSSEGAGTTVTVTLPVSPVAADQPPATPYRRSPASPSPGTM